MSEAKKTIWSVASYATRPTERLKVADTFAEILKVLDYCDKNSVELPKFVTNLTKSPRGVIWGGGMVRGGQMPTPDFPGGAKLPPQGALFRP